MQFPDYNDDARVQTLGAMINSFGEMGIIKKDRGINDYMNMFYQKRVKLFENYQNNKDKLKIRELFENA